MRSEQKELDQTDVGPFKPVDFGQFSWQPVQFLVKVSSCSFRISYMWNLKPTNWNRFLILEPEIYPTYSGTWNL